MPGDWGCSAAATGDLRWLDRELPILAGATSQPWGVGFQSWRSPPAAVDHVLEHGPAR